MSTTRFVFTGQIVPQSFEEFARHRARRLDLTIEMGSADIDRTTMTVSGADALVDMFEMACSLGPYDCIIHDIQRQDAF